MDYKVGDKLEFRGASSWIPCEIVAVILNHAIPGRNVYIITIDGEDGKTKHTRHIETKLQANQDLRRPIERWYCNVYAGPNYIASGDLNLGERKIFIPKGSCIGHFIRTGDGNTGTYEFIPEEKTS